MMKRFRWAALVAFLALPAAAELEAQGSIGLDGVISNRVENAFGVGLTFAWTTPLSGSFKGRPFVLKALLAGDLEIVTGELTPGHCRIPDAEGRVYYYEECSGGRLVGTTVAQASPPLRLYGSAYAVVDWWRIRLGPGVARGIPGGVVSSGLVGFAVSPSSWLMVEAPHAGGWRLRIEMTLYGPPFVW